MENKMNKQFIDKYPIILEPEKLDIFFDWLTHLCYDIEKEIYIIKDFILCHISPRTKNFPIQLHLHSYKQQYLHEDNNGYKTTKSRWLYTIQKDSIKLLSDIPKDYHFYTINDLLEMSNPTIQQESEPTININQQIINILNENKNHKIVELGNLVDSILN